MWAKIRTDLWDTKEESVGFLQLHSRAIANGFWLPATKSKHRCKAHFQWFLFWRQRCCLPCWKKHQDRLSWLHSSRLERKQPLGGRWSLKLSNGIPWRKRSCSCHTVCGEATEEEQDGNSWYYLAKRKSSFTWWMWKSRTHWLSKGCFAGIQEACTSGFNLAYPKIHLKQHICVKIECLDNDSSSLCAALCSHLCLHNYATVTR